MFYVLLLNESLKIFFLGWIIIYFFLNKRFVFGIYYLYYDMKYIKFCRGDIVFVILMVDILVVNLFE